MATSDGTNSFKYSFCLKSNTLVALAAFWVNFCLHGVLRSNAVIYNALVDVFGINRQYAAWPSGIFGFFMSVTGAVSGILTNYWSIRTLAIFGALLSAVSVSICSLACQMQHIILFYGALQGIGIGLIVPLTHVVLNQNFTKYRACAMGIAYSGSSVGSFLFPPISNYLLEVYSLSGTFLLLGGVMLNALPGAMFFTTPQNQRQKDLAIPMKCSVVFQYETKNTTAIVITKFDKEEFQNKRLFSKDHSDTSTPNGCQKAFSRFKKHQSFVMAIEILSSPHFLIISLAYAAYFTSSVVFLMVVLDFASDRGVNEPESVFLVSAYSIGDLAGRLSSGWMADIQIVRRSTLVRLYLIAMGMLLILFPTLPNSAMPIISVALGVISGGLIVNHSVLFNEYLGLQKLPMTMGFATCFVGMSAFVRPVIIGYFRDYHQSYNFLFVFLGLSQMVIAAIWFLELIIPFMNQRFFVNKTVH